MSEAKLPFALAGPLARLQESASRIGLREAVQISLRLDAARQQLADLGRVPTILRVLLLGGTGVGKSTLFSALVGQRDASPGSEDVRLFTRRPYVAIARSQRGLSCVPAECGPQFVDAPWEGIELIDTPDVDGALAEHRLLVEQLVERCDVIVYVTMPDKRSNFDIQEELRIWGSRKRWIFVMNKIDREASQLVAIRNDFDTRLRALGFQPNEEVRFLVSATEPNRFEFGRFRSTVLDPGQALLAPRFRLDGALGLAEYAVEPALIEPMISVRQQLMEREQSLLSRVRNVYRRVLEDPLLEDSFRQALREQVWANVGERTGGPIGLALWLRCRLGLLWSVYRLGTGRSFGLTRTVWTAISSMVRGVQPIASLAVGLDNTYRREMEDIAVEARRTVEDRGLREFVQNERADESLTEDDGSAGLSPAERVALAPFRAAYRALNRLALGEADAKLFETVRTDLDRIARKAAAAVAIWPVRWLANLLPVAFLGQVLYRVGHGWWKEEYLEPGFFAMAAVIFGATLVPGYLLLAARIRSKVGKLDVEALLASIDEAPATRPITEASRQLGSLVEEAEQFRRMVRTIRTGIGEELRFATARAESNITT